MNPAAILLAIVAAAPWIFLAAACAPGRPSLAVALMAIGMLVCLLAVSLGKARAR